ncbi:hypothetical protein VTN77DRAFT_5774 [Rasamsonia byssochlamydoides]|uniref:uncharacterized protein n=1 Tax=Rasamsonia byssochlamydoides TaxID=89139 RepID=UPI0037420DE5
MAGLKYSDNWVNQIAVKAERDLYTQAPRIDDLYLLVSYLPYSVLLFRLAIFSFLFGGDHSAGTVHSSRFNLIPYSILFPAYILSLSTSARRCVGANMTGAPILPTNAHDKPRLRSACDSCRQSKVKCSGGSTCLRCNKQGVPCKYSLASRAGKPKGSRNKATLKKLEELQEKIQQKMHSNRNTTIEATSQFWHSFKPSASTSSYVNYGEEDNYYQTSYDGLVPSSDVEWGSQGSLDFQAQPIQTPIISSRGSPYSSPLPTGPDEFFLSDATRTDPEPLIRLTELPHPSPSLSLYACSPTQDMASSLNSLTESSTSRESCDCFESQAASLNQLYNLDRDMAMWRFDLSIQAVNASLAACQKFLHCQLCRKECANLLVSISTLDLLFRVFRQLLSRDVSQDDPFLDDSCSIRCGQYSVPREEGALVRSFLIHRMLNRSKEMLAAMREVVETYYANPDGQQQQQQIESWEGERASNYDFLLEDETAGDLTTTTLFLWTQYNYGIHESSSTTTTSSLSSSFEPIINNRLSASDVNFLRQVIARCETILEGLRTFTFRYATPGS